MNQKDILIIGGNLFFGLHLTRRLLNAGHKVTLLNRGNKKPVLEGNIHHIVCDRHNATELAHATKNKTWDMVFDQVCYDYNTAKNACEVFNDKTSRYIFTSTMSVYDPMANAQEKDFDYSTYQFNEFADCYKDYTNAKRQAERAFYEHGKFSYLFARFPFVVGTDDYTGRLKFHAEQIKNGKPIVMPNFEAHMSFVPAAEAARGLEYFAFSQLEGAINITANEIKLKDFITIIEQKLGKKAILQNTGDAQDHSSYGVEKDWYMSNALAQTKGFEIAPVDKWLSDMIVH